MCPQIPGPVVCPLCARELIELQNFFGSLTFQMQHPNVCPTFSYTCLRLKCNDLFIVAVLCTILTCGANGLHRARSVQTTCTARLAEARIMEIASKSFVNGHPLKKIYINKLTFIEIARESHVLALLKKAGNLRRGS